MINLDIDVLVNGKPIRISQDLNDLLSDYILKKVGITPRANILDNVDMPTKKYPSAKVYGGSGRNKQEWDDEETLKFATRVETIRVDGTSFGKIGKILSPEFKDRSPGALYQKIVELKRKGVIKII